MKFITKDNKTFPIRTDGGKGFIIWKDLNETQVNKLLDNAQEYKLKPIDYSQLRSRKQQLYQDRIHPQTPEFNREMAEINEKDFFHLSKDFTYARIDRDQKFTGYSEGVIFAQNGKDVSNKVFRFGKDGFGTSPQSLIKTSTLSDVVKEAKESEFGGLGKFSSVRSLTGSDKIKVFVSEFKNKPVLLKANNSKGDPITYMIAPYFPTVDGVLEYGN